MALTLKPLVKKKEISEQAKHRCGSTASGSFEFESSLQGQWVGPRGKPGDSVKLKFL